jgi:hypothetical protein
VTRDAAFGPPTLPTWLLKAESPTAKWLYLPACLSASHTLVLLLLLLLLLVVVIVVWGKGNGLLGGVKPT